MSDTSEGASEILDKVLQVMAETFEFHSSLHGKSLKNLKHESDLFLCKDPYVGNVDMLHPHNTGVTVIEGGPPWGMLTLFILTTLGSPSKKEVPHDHIPV